MKKKKARRPAVAGLFYPRDPDALRHQVQSLLEEARRSSHEDSSPRAMIMPHAGYVYSGLVAALGYVLLEKMRGRLRRVLLLGPAHLLHTTGMALPDADVMETPLGDMRVSPTMRARALQNPEVAVSDPAHEGEHSLEVHLPFLQVVLGDVEVLPVAVGRGDPCFCADLIEDLFAEDTMVIVSSDLSHFLDLETARRVDSETTRAIEELRIEDIGYDRACGADAIKALLLVAKRRRLGARSLYYGTSADAEACDPSRVVGYGIYVIE